MFPLKDDNPTSRIAWVTWLLIALNLAMFGYEFWLSLSNGAAFEAFVSANAFVPARFFSDPMAPRQWLTALSAMFMHGGWVHVGGNMLYLWIFGNNVEDRLGPLRFIGFYLLCGLVATLAQAFVAPASAVPNLGASGAVAGVLGAYVLLYPKARVTTLIFLFFIIEMAALPAWAVIIGWFLLQLAQGLGSLGQGAGAGGVAYFAHVGGFATGVLLAVPLALNDRRYRARSAGWPGPSG
jgi:membrane associated rhomboid family serine protease